MALTLDDIGRLTLAELEAIADRFSTAVRTIREAQSLLGGPTVVMTTTQPVQNLAPRPPPQNNNFTPAELSERAKLLAQIRGPELPADIQMAMGEQ
jgi:hypothetical protein